MNFRLIDSGRMVSCRIIKTFKNDKTGINYVAYTDGTLNSNGNPKIYAPKYFLDDNDYILEPIESNDEWDFIDTALSESVEGVN